MKKIIFIIPLLMVTFILIFINFKDIEVENKVLTIKPTTIEKDENIFSKDVDLEYARTKEYKNKDIVARLEIPSLFNIYITQTKDNDYYLNHSIYRKKDKKGTEFMDFRVNKDSNQINIYGHNSKTYNLPFVQLEKFLDKHFFQENKEILLQFDNERQTYEILSIKETKKDYTHMNVNVKKDKFVEHINNLKKNSIHERDIKYNKNSKILVLQTCSYNEKDSFYIIIAIKKDTNN